MVTHLTLDELNAGLEEIRRSPSDVGVVKAIVVRPNVDERQELERLIVTSRVFPEALRRVCPSPSPSPKRGGGPKTPHRFGNRSRRDHADGVERRLVRDRRFTS